MKKIITVVLLFTLLGCAGTQVQGEKTVAEAHYLSKILLVVDSPDTGLRTRYENALRKVAQLYTPRVETIVSSPVMLNLTVLSSEKDLVALAAQYQFDGLLEISGLHTTTRDSRICPGSKSKDTLGIIVDALTTSCATVHVPKVTCTARLLGMTPYQELWHTEASAEGTPQSPKTKGDLFEEIAVKVLKAVQRHKFILPSRYKNI
jgi:hypothetical protein